MNYKAIGEMGQNCVIGELSKYGLGIAVLLSDNYPFDFIVVAGPKNYRVQVKTTTQNRNNKFVSFKLTSSNYFQGTTNKYTSIDCDAIVCYDLVEHKTFLLTHDDINNQNTFTIRYAPVENKHRKDIHWEKDYILSNERVRKVFDFDPPNIEIYFNYVDEKKYQLICSNCKKDFISSNKYAKCCSSKCKGEVRRKVIRPDKDNLIDLIKNNNLCKIGRQYNVSDNAVRKWARSYGLDIRKIKEGIV